MSTRKKQDKDRTQKTADEMNLGEFVTWATGYIIFGIAEGNQLRYLVHTIIIQCCENTVFGGQKKL